MVVEGKGWGEVVRWKEHKNEVRGMRWGRNAQWLVTASKDRTVKGVGQERQRTLNATDIHPHLQRSNTAYPAVLPLTLAGWSDDMKVARPGARGCTAALHLLHEHTTPSVSRLSRSVMAAILRHLTKGRPTTASAASTLRACSGRRVLPARLAGLSRVGSEQREPACIHTSATIPISPQLRPLHCFCHCCLIRQATATTSYGSGAAPLNISIRVEVRRASLALVVEGHHLPRQRQVLLDEVLVRLVCVVLLPALPVFEQQLDDVDDAFAAVAVAGVQVGQALLARLSGEDGGQDGLQLLELFVDGRLLARVPPV